jgi:myo-inositol-1(or 4)-monophosphatase
MAVASLPRAVSAEHPSVRRFLSMLPRARALQRTGSAALNLAYVACGRLDVYWSSSLQPWDMAAGALLVTEAGGVVTDFSGGQRWLDRGNIVGAAPKVHAELLAIIARHVSEDELDHRKGARPGV